MNAKKFRKRQNRAGLPPGMLSSPDHKNKEVPVEWFHYDSDNLDKGSGNSDSIPWDSFADGEKVHWLNVFGLDDHKLLSEFKDRFSIHPLTLEDTLDTDQRPKTDDYKDYIYIVARMIHSKSDDPRDNSEQISILIKNNLVISIQEAEDDVFEPIRRRIQYAEGQIRNKSAGYLAYALIDALVDNYYSFLENMEERLDTLENRLLDENSPQILSELKTMKKQLVYLRKNIWPMRDVINNLQRGSSPLINEDTRVYLSDVYDHIVRVMDMVDTFRDLLSGLMDVYLSLASNKMNQVMKTLTIISTIFIPLTFIAGVYGMNFRYMPELDWKWSYPLTWTVMIMIAVSLIIFFKRKKWF